MRLDVQFNPFTYEELIRPIADYNAAYNALADSYATLSDQTEAFRNEVNATDSPIAYEQFNKYSDNLSAAIDDFSKGMTSSNRASLLNMKRRYGKEIGTIAKAAEARKAAENFRTEISATNPNAVFEVDHYKSLDPFLEGKQANNEYWNGTTAFNRLSAKAEALGKALFSNPDYELYLDDGQKYKITQLNGMPLDEFIKVLNDPRNINTDAGREMRELLEEELGNVDFRKYSTEGRYKINTILNTAMYAGLAKPTYNFIDNDEYISKADRISLDYDRRRVELEEKQYEDAKKAEDIATGQQPYYTDSDGNKYYSNGKYEWTEDKDGNKSAPKKVTKATEEVDPSSEEATLKKAAKEFIMQDFYSTSSGDHLKPGGEFSVSDSDEITFEDLLSNQQKEVEEFLKRRGLNINQVTIYKDVDYFSNNHYRIVKKGYDIQGNISDENESAW